MEINIGSLSEKSLAMLFYVYMKEEDPDQKFISKLISQMSKIKDPLFDNFDLLLLVQSVKLSKVSFLNEQREY